MTFLKSAVFAACTVSLLGIGAAYAQTDPAAAPATPAAPAAAPATDAGMAAKPPMKKKHKMSKKMMKKKTT